jgi:hypothetical protein
MSAEQAGLKVSDQRHFSADGSPRASANEPPRPEAERQGDNAPRTAAAVASAVDFSSFILSLAAQASLLLHGDPGGDGEVEPPAGDKEAAQRVIAILEMLQDKSEGRRTAEETRLLEELLFELRMAYVARSQRGGR